MMKHLKLSLVLASAISMTACAAGTYSDNASTSPAKKNQTVMGEVWASPTGKSLYTFAKDKAGVSNCYDACAAKWPPLFAEKSKKAGKSDNSGFSIIERKDGTYQWAYKEMPLYTWIKDQASGDVTGHGVKNVWFVARADDAPVKVFVKDSQAILTDTRQMSLYTFDKDTTGKSNCNGGCAAKWPPLLAEDNATATAPYSLVTRDDGKQQWAVNGQPLYAWIKDTKPGDTTGDGVKGVWHLAIMK